MKKLTASLTWGLVFGLVAFFLVSRGMATPTKPVSAKKGQVIGKVVAKGQTSQTRTVVTKERNPVLPPFLVGLTIFVLSIFIGFELISKVPPLLHSPLMSGANAISGITIVGALACARTGSFSSFSAILGLFAVTCAMINVVGGFWVTDRMIQMYIKKK